MTTSSSVELPNRFVSNSLMTKINSQTLYQNHQKRLIDIRNSVSPTKSKQVIKLSMASSLQRYRQNAKASLFDHLQQECQRENAMLLTKLRGIYESEPRMKPNKSPERKIISKMLDQKKKNTARILHQNLLLIDHLKSSSKTSKQMKANIKQQIKQYLSKRALHRRKVLPEEQKRHQKQLNFSKVRPKSLTTIEAILTLRSNRKFNLN